MNTETRNCQNCKAAFVIEPDDFAFYERIQVPPPTFCPRCRDQRRMAFRNERSLYRRKCDLCGKNIITRFSPDKPYPVYCRECWWSDKWDPKSFGKDYDFSRPFFEQFKELLYSVPQVALITSNTVQSDWVNQETDDKNCYLNFGGHFNEDSAYNIFELRGKDSFDNYWLLGSELCYESINCENCYQALFSRDCTDCRNTTLSMDCHNCSDCFGCAGLRNKRYHIWNRPHTKEEYEKFLAENPLTHSNLERLRAEAEKVWLSVPRRFAAIYKSKDVTGDILSESKNSKDCWFSEKLEDTKHIYIAADLKDCWDITAVGWSELAYESAHAMGINSSKFCTYSIVSGTGAPASVNLEYCYGTVTSNNCFGCVNLSKGEHCILNKQYSKEEYAELKKKIIRQMSEMPYRDRLGREYRYGEFFPSEISLYVYNETGAQDYYPLTREKAEAQGFTWQEMEDVHEAVPDLPVPDDIREVRDDILNQTLKCEVSGRPYRIIPMELQFYRRLQLPLPRRAPEQRQRDRIRKLLPKVLHRRQCDCEGSGGKYANQTEHFHGEEKCPNTFETPYASDRPETVYCEQCYQAETA
ncbi:MAG: hypothetical protein UY99_C0005G0024 [Parcubacteria group bacterium GW2011_GWA1_59_11]|nr:MAG: hypothetical protein UY99_C0005G0024 [Parcubacteria group bacterium GW2011_GWA1_59_11]